MRKIFYLFVVLCVISCTQSNEDKIKVAFKEYAISNFDDPSQLEEIVSIDSLDTISTIEVKKQFSELMEIRKRTKKLTDSIRAINNKFFNDKSLVPRIVSNYNFKDLLSKSIEWSEYEIYLLDHNISMEAAEKDWKDILSHKDTVFYQNRLKYRIKNNGELKLKTYYVYSDTLYNKINFKETKLKAYEISDIFKEIDDLNDKYHNLFEMNQQRGEIEIKILTLLRREFGNIY